jgi:hypothetical protein
MNIASESTKGWRDAVGKEYESFVEKRETATPLAKQSEGISDDDIPF